MLCGPARFVAGDHFFRHDRGPLDALAQSARRDAHHDVEDVLIGKLNFPFWQRLQYWIMPPDTEQCRVFWRAACGVLEHDYLPNHSRAIPLWKTHPDTITVFIQPRRFNDGAIAVTLDTLLGIALPDAHHRIQAFFLLLHAQVGIRSAIWWIVFSLHL